LVSCRDATTIPNYWAYASNFVLQDRMFEPNFGWSEPAHLFLVSGWSAKCLPPTDAFNCGSSNRFVDVDRGNRFPDSNSHQWTDLTYLMHEQGVEWRFLLGTGPVTVTLVLIGRSRLALLDYGIVIALEFGLALWLIPRYGLIGGAAARAIGTATNNILPLVQIWKSEATCRFARTSGKPPAPPSSLSSRRSSLSRRHRSARASSPRPLQRCASSSSMCRSSSR
jgi:hypothetical protein